MQGWWRDDEGTTCVSPPAVDQLSHGSIGSRLCKLNLHLKCCTVPSSCETFSWAFKGILIRCSAEVVVLVAFKFWMLLFTFWSSSPSVLAVFICRWPDLLQWWHCLGTPSYPMESFSFFLPCQGSGSEVQPLIKICPLLVLIVGIGHFLNLYTLNTLTCLSLGVL